MQVGARPVFQADGFRMARRGSSAVATAHSSSVWALPLRSVTGTHVPCSAAGRRVAAAMTWVVGLADWSVGQHQQGSCHSIQGRTADANMAKSNTQETIIIFAPFRACSLITWLPACRRAAMPPACCQHLLGVSDISLSSYGVPQGACRYVHILARCRRAADGQGSGGWLAGGTPGWRWCRRSMQCMAPAASWAQLRARPDRPSRIAVPASSSLRSGRQSRAQTC